MAAFDLNAQFENISEKANAASERIQLAADETRDRLAADAAIAQDKASELPIASKIRPRRKHDTTSEHWREIRDQWHLPVLLQIVRPSEDRPPICLRPRRRACSHRQRQVRRVAHGQHPNRQPLIGRSRCRTQRRAQHAVSTVDATVEAPHNVCAFARVSG
jgi:hypothetical protein